MIRSASARTLALLWLCWAATMLGYQAFVEARFAPERPDHALFWTPNETRVGSLRDRPYLREPLLNRHAAWDSEYYLSIASAGYDDPQMRAIPPSFNWASPQIAPKRDQPDWITLNYAFFPLYPLAARVLALPLGLLGLGPLATVALAAMLVSLLGTLGAMLALADLFGDPQDEASGRRAAFYLLIFPAGMFLAQIYTEGFFLGLSFGALALARRGRWVWAGLLAAAATWTRASGALLLLPLLWCWWQGGGFALLRVRPAVGVRRLLLACAPLPAYLLWNAALGAPFHTVEAGYFGRGLLSFAPSWYAWSQAAAALSGDSGPTKAYYLIEFAATGLGLLTCALLLRRDPALALYGLALILFALTSGVAQGMHRYVMASPALFLVPARWGRHELFDRAWTLLCLLLMGVYAAMFTFDFWAG
ncbi:MAG: hypothetical protein OHK0022_10770 [Roseiflexaceae bacterium]